VGGGRASTAAVGGLVVVRKVPLVVSAQDQPPIQIGGLVLQSDNPAAILVGVPVGVDPARPPEADPSARGKPDPDRPYTGKADDKGKEAEPKGREDVFADVHGPVLVGLVVVGVVVGGGAVIGAVVAVGNILLRVCNILRRNVIAPGHGRSGHASLQQVQDQDGSRQNGCCLRGASNCKRHCYYSIRFDSV